MKIIFDFRKYNGIIGGIEQGVIQISRRMSEKNHSIIILCRKNKFKEAKKIFRENREIKIIPLNTTSSSMSKRNARLDSTTIQDIAKREKADIIHFFHNWSFPKNKKVPCVLTIHDVIPLTYREAMGFFKRLFLYKSGTKKAYQLNDMITTVSEFSKKDIHEKIGVPLKKIRVIPNGLREVSSKNSSLEESLKKKFNLDKFILNVGGIHERKNIVRLIEAFSNLVKLDHYPGKLLITGSTSGHPYINKMKKLCDKAVKKTGMKDKIIFSEFVKEDELDSFFRMADFLIYPSLYEGFGMPILEAMKMGLPVITSNVTGTLEVASDIAILIDPTNTKEMTKKMAELLKDKKSQKEMIKKGKRKAKSYTWKKIAENYLKLYEDVIASFK